MDARTRRRTAFLALLLPLALGAWLWSGAVESPAPSEEGAVSGAAASDARVPTLAAAPGRLGGDRVPQREGAKGDADANPAARTGSDEFPFGFCYGSDVDDPALPKERVPLAVTLVDPAGKPVPRAAVQAVWGEWRTKTYVADADGHATLSVPRGARALEVVGMPRSETRHFLLVHYHPLSGVESETRVEVRVGSEVSGTLVDPEGKPLAKAKIRAVPQAFGIGPTTTDDHGEFRLGVLDGTDVDVRFDGWLDAPAPCEFCLLRARAIRVRAGTSDLRLTATTVSYEESLRLRVLLPNGEPAPGAEVLCTMNGGTHGQSLSTDATGRVVVTGQAPWPTDVAVRLRPDVVQRFVDLVPDGREVDLRLDPRVELKGRVLDASGKPVVRAWCVAFNGHGYVACFATDAEGRFSTMLPVAPGARFQLSARFPMEEPTSRGVLNEVVAGTGEQTIVLEEVGPLESDSRRANKPKFTVGAVSTLRAR